MLLPQVHRAVTIQLLLKKKGQALRQTLHNIIDDHRVIKYSSNNPDTADALAKLDADPDNPNSVILIYSRRSEAISNFGTSSGWNREHLWCNSSGSERVTKRLKQNVDERHNIFAIVVCSSTVSPGRNLA